MSSTSSDSEIPFDSEDAGNKMKTKLIYFLVLCHYPAAQPLANEEWKTKFQEVDAGKECERALEDRLEGNDM